MVLVLTGDPGADSLTLGRPLASELGWSLVEANDRQSSASTSKLRRGQSLTSGERAVWIQRVRAIIERLVDRREHAVIVCGPLEDAEYLTLRAGLKTVRFVQLLVTAANLERGETGRDTPTDRPRSVSYEPRQPTPDGIRIGVPMDLTRAEVLASIVRRIRLEFGL